MLRVFGHPPSLAEIETMARRALDRLPAPFLPHLETVLLAVEDFADDETLSAMGIADGFDLTGLYEGVPITDQPTAQTGDMPARIRLFRSPILDEWIARGDETLENLVAHVLIHEIGHHFGLSDDHIEALERGIEA